MDKEELDISHLVLLKMAGSKYDEYVYQDDVCKLIGEGKYSYGEIKSMSVLELYDALIGQGRLFSS